MKVMLKHSCAAALVILCLGTAARADIKIKSRASFGGQPGPEQTTYIKGKRQRSDSPGGHTSIMQCDLRRSVQLNSTTKTYFVSPFGDAAQTAATATAGGATAAEPVRRGGVVTTTMTTTDTGERKQMFGYTARRIKTSMVTESSPDACNKQKSRMDSDGWYIDFAVGFDCYDSASASGYQYQAPDGCRDQYRTRRVGAAKMGYPVQVTTTMYDETGKVTGTFTQEVLEISKAVLEASLFDVPADYREVKSMQEMFSAQAMSSAASNDAPDADAGGATAGDEAGGAGELGAKRPGVVRVGLAPPVVTAAEGMNAPALAEAAQNTMFERLAGHGVELVTLGAQTDAEARRKDCDYVVVMNVTHKRGGGGGLGGFLKKAAPVVTGEVLAGSGTIKARDEVTLDYRLQPTTGGAPVAGKTLKAKARSDGEDIISPLVSQAAAEVLAAAKSSRQ